MKKLLTITGFFLLFTAMPALSQESNSSTTKTVPGAQKTTDERKRKDLYSRWEKLNKDKPVEARQIAVEYFVNFPDDKSKKGVTLKTWLENYDKSGKIESDIASPGKITPNSDEVINTIAKTAADSVAGTWTIVVPTAQGDMHFTLVLTQVDKIISGSVQSIYGKGSVSSGKIEGNLINLELQADPLEVKLKGTVDDNKMKGTVTSNIPNIPVLTFVGTRSN